MRFLAIWLVLLLAVTASGQTILAKPKTGFVLDRAKILSSGTVSQINEIARASKEDEAAPIYVVTIPSLASVKARSVESYATRLFNAWHIGDRSHNKGILLLVALKDRKARIEMGAGWSHDMDSQCDEIMSGSIVPNFKQEAYSAGVLEGVQALATLARTGEVYETYPGTGSVGIEESSPTVMPIYIFCGVSLFVIIARLLRGLGGNYRRYPGNPFIGGMFRGGGGFGGGGFSGGGGGFSGGGGASGSW